MTRYMYMHIILVHVHVHVHVCVHVVGMLVHNLQEHVPTGLYTIVICCLLITLEMLGNQYTYTYM